MRTGGPAESWKVIPIAPEPVTVFDAKELHGLSLGSPSVEVLPGGTIVVSMDQHGSGAVKLPGKKGKNPHFNNWLQGRVMSSNDQGKTWEFRHSYPFSHARLFRDGNSLYLLGDAGSVQIIRSADGGNTWTHPEDLTAKESDGDAYVQSPTAVLRVRGNIYAAAMKITDFRYRGTYGSTHAPVVMRAREGSNLLSVKRWAFSEPAPPFRELISQDTLDHFGVPFFSVPHADRAEAVGHQRWADRIGWHDAHVLQIKDPNHYWYDPSGRTSHFLACAAAHRSNMALLAKVHEDDKGRMMIGLERTPAGRSISFIPLPGGNLKFHILYDEPSALYWLVSNQVRDSMTRADKLPRDRRGLPCDEDSRLQLHFSSNLVDWCFAGYVDAAASSEDFRYDSCMAVGGNDLCIVCLAGGADGSSIHNAARVLMYTIPNFRELVY